eukprot:COSAG06_NODE_1771_length_8429_cov_4.298679_10_plen_94_part_00
MRNATRLPSVFLNKRKATICQHRLGTANTMKTSSKALAFRFFASALRCFTHSRIHALTHSRSGGDDCVAIKSGWDCFGVAYAKPCVNITVRPQ